MNHPRLHQLSHCALAEGDPAQGILSAGETVVGSFLSFNLKLVKGTTQ
jgi:hypothetical protein